MDLNKPKARDKAVVLLSGGIDSTVTLYLVKKYRFGPYVLIFDYKQRHKKEILFAVNTAKRLKAPYKIVKIGFPWGGSALTDRKIKVPLTKSRGIPVTYVPGRNLVFLSLAVSFAETIKAKKIFIGAHIQDYSGYPDCRPEFLESFSRTANLGIKHKGIKIESPLLDKGKTEIIKLGYSLGVDFSKTWSCYQGSKNPCGKCDSCRYRREGFKKAGFPDPLMGEG